MTISVGGSGGGGLYMPQMSTTQDDGIWIKTAPGTNAAANNASFWTGIDLSHTGLGYETVKLAAAADTTEQTILDVTDSGVLTHVLAPALGSAGTMTIRVTVDGTVTTFTSETLNTADRLCLGAFVGGSGTSGTSGTVGLSSNVDPGYSITEDAMSMPTPIQSIANFAVGMVFKTSLKVTIQGSVNITASANQLNGCANYTLAIPEGL